MYIAEEQDYDGTRWWGVFDDYWGHVLYKCETKEEAQIWVDGDKKRHKELIWDVWYGPRANKQIGLDWQEGIDYSRSG